ncbi:oligosaccharide flippase family protein [Thermoflexus sp.]|uniref:oligosaccharide flippase family protein n=1 Tax=Thermoflexus sp. TaxID=1969742 RepID=UPI002ADE8EC1|nr:oligosaccharide flippase family protein [Thermoflexus sp.]
MERATSEEPLAYRAVRGGLWVALSAYWTLAFGFVANILLTRMLAPEAFGTFALAMFFAQLFRIQTKLRLGYAFGQHPETTGESLGTYAVLEGAAALGGLVLMGMMVPVLRALGYGEQVVMAALVLSFAAFLEGIASIAGTLLEKGLRFGATSLYQSLVFPLSYLPAFWLALHGGGVWSLVAQTTVYSFLLLGLLVIARQGMPHLWKARWGFRRDLALSFLRFGGAAGLWLMAGTLFAQLDNFLIGTFVGVTVLGYYDRAYRIAQWPALVFNAVLARTVFYTYARLQGDRERLEKMMTMITWAIGMIASPLALAILLTAREIVLLLYGERWLPSVVFLQILIAFFVVRPHLEHAGVLLNATGKPGRAAVLQWIQVGVLGIAGVPLTLQWGALGTCGAVGLALAIGWVLAWFFLRRDVQLDGLQALELWRMAVVLLTAVLLVLLLSDLLEPFSLDAWASAVLKFVGVFICFYAVMLAIDPSTMRERMMYLWTWARKR